MSRTFFGLTKTTLDRYYLLRLSEHFLAGLDGIAACHQCTSPPTFWISLPRSSPPYQMRHKIDALFNVQRVDLVTQHPATLGSGERAVALMANAILSVSANISPTPILHLYPPGSNNVATPDTLGAQTWTIYRCFSLEGHGRFQSGIWPPAPVCQIPYWNRPWHQSSDAARNAEVRWSTAILQKSSKYFTIVVLFDLGFFDVPAHGSIAAELHLRSAMMMPDAIHKVGRGLSGSFQAI